MSNSKRLTKYLRSSHLNYKSARVNFNRLISVHFYTYTHSYSRIEGETKHHILNITYASSETVHIGRFKSSLQRQYNDSVPAS